MTMFSTPLVVEERLKPAEGEEQIEGRPGHRRLGFLVEHCLSRGEATAGVPFEGVVDELPAEKLLVEGTQRRPPVALGPFGEQKGNLLPDLAGERVERAHRCPGQLVARGLAEHATGWSEGS